VIKEYLYFTATANYNQLNYNAVVVIIDDSRYRAIEMLKVIKWY